LKLAAALGVVGLSIFAISNRADAQASAAFAKVYASIRTDPSFKVRLQAIRILVKQIKGGAKAEDQVFAVLGEAAQKDEEKLVRGLACFALGELGDPRGKDGLKAALKDPEAFVRAQAEDALKLVEKSAPAIATNVARNALSFAIDDSPGVTAPPEVFDALRRFLDAEVKAQAVGKFEVGAAGAAGYRFGGSIAQLSIEADAAGGNRVTAVVRIAITTMPENHLRHVMTAKASAATKSSAGVPRLRDQVLQAAVVRAVKDSLAALSSE
jgi:hypothetical protein